MLKKIQKEVVKKIVVLMSLLIITICNLHASELEPAILVEELGQLFAPIEEEQGQLLSLGVGQDEDVSNNELEQKKGNRRRLREVKIFLFSKEHEKLFKKRKEQKRLKAERERRERREERLRKEELERRGKNHILFIDRVIGEEEQYRAERRRRQEALAKETCPYIKIRVKEKQPAANHAKIRPGGGVVSVYRLKNGPLANIAHHAQSKKQVQKQIRSSNQQQNLNPAELPEELSDKSCWDCLLDCCLGYRI